jgi:hypothetical protein
MLLKADRSTKFAAVAVSRIYGSFSRLRLSGTLMRVRLTRKLAECLDGIDVSGHEVGDLLTLDRREAELLIAEGWAVASSGRTRDVRSSTIPKRAVTAASRAARRPLAGGVVTRLRTVHKQLTQGRFDPCDQRRAEDRIREEIRNARAHVAKPRG